MFLFKGKERSKRGQAVRAPDLIRRRWVPRPDRWFVLRSPELNLRPALVKSQFVRHPLACSRLRDSRVRWIEEVQTIRKCKHENKTGGNWGEQGPANFSLAFFFRVLPSESLNRLVGPLSHIMFHLNCGMVHYLWKAPLGERIIKYYYY